MKKVFISLIFMFLFSSVFACDNGIKSSQKILASNVNFDLSYKINDDKATFSLTVTGLNDNLYITDQKGKVYSGNKEGNLVINNIQTGKNNYYIYSNAYSYCSFGVLLTRTINVPTYNPYYNDELCGNHKNSDLCSRWNSIDLTYEEFKSAISRLDKVEQDTVIDDFVDDKIYVFDYSIWLVIGIIFVSGIVLYFVERKKIGF